MCIPNIKQNILTNLQFISKKIKSDFGLMAEHSFLDTWFFNYMFRKRKKCDKIVVILFGGIGSGI